MAICKKCKKAIGRWETWYYHGESYCERCFNQLVYEDIQTKGGRQ